MRVFEAGTRSGRATAHLCEGGNTQKEERERGERGVVVVCVCLGGGGGAERERERERGRDRGRGGGRDLVSGEVDGGRSEVLLIGQVVLEARAHMLLTYESVHVYAVHARGTTYTAAMPQLSY